MMLRGFRSVRSNDEVPKIMSLHVQIGVYFTFLTLVIFGRSKLYFLSSDVREKLNF